MDILQVPPAVRDKLGDAGSDGVLMMFAEAHGLAVQSFERTLRETEDRLDRRMTEISERFDQALRELEARFERRLMEEISKIRLEMAALKFDLLKWSFLFWIGQVAVMIAVLSWMLRGIR